MITMTKTPGNLGYEEVWKQIPGFDIGYQCSSFGNFRSISRKENPTRRNCIRKTKILKQKMRGEYLTTGLMVNGEQKNFSSHRLLAITFIPNPENKPFINHKDGNKLNNHIKNLEWCTKSENAKHSFAMGLQSTRGEKHPSNKLTEKQVLDIRSKYIPNTYSFSMIAKEYKVTKQCIVQIINRKNWSHI